MAADPDLGLGAKLALAVADQIKSSGKDRATRERHALAMAQILHPDQLPKGGWVLWCVGAGQMCVGAGGC